MAKTTKAPVVSQPEAQAPAAIDWSKYQNQPTGFEHVNREDLGIPFLSICQKGSPEVDKSSPEHALKKIEGIQVGDVFNTLTRQIVYVNGEDPLIFIPCGYRKQYVEWKPRNSGGGFVRAHSDAAILNEIVTRNEKNEDVLRNGNNLVTTAYFFGFIPQESGEPTLVVIGMTSTQLKQARFWLNLMSGIRVGPARMTPPMFSHEYSLSTSVENNEKGSWMGWKIAVRGMVSDANLVAESVKVAAKLAAGDRGLLGAGTKPLESNTADDKL